MAKKNDLHKCLWAFSKFKFMGIMDRNEVDAVLDHLEHVLFKAAVTINTQCVKDAKTRKICSEMYEAWYYLGAIGAGRFRKEKDRRQHMIDAYNCLKHPLNTQRRFLGTAKRRAK